MLDQTELRPPRDCTFDPADWAVLARCWHPVAIAADIGAAPVAARLLDERLVLWRAGGAIRIARDLCLHRGVPLSLGWVEGEELVCKYHGLRYAADGACVKIPADPSARIPPKLRLSTYPAEERFGLVWTQLVPDAAQKIPPMPAWDDPDYQTILPPFIDIGGAAGRQMEGFLDVAHFAFVHDQTFAVREKPEVPSYQVRWDNGVLLADCPSDVPNYPHGSGLVPPPGFTWWRRFAVHLPFTAQLTIDFPGADRLVILNCASPMSARRTRLFVPIARNFGKDGDLQAVYDFNRRIFEEDRQMVESQYPEDLPLDLAAEAHIKADRTSIAYRQALAGMGLGRSYTA